PHQPATFERSIQKVFRNELLAYTSCDKIDREYFARAQEQFKYIRETVQAVFNSPTCQIDKDGALLEPSFLCEHLGLQGRMDFLQGDFRNLIELKSGKAEGFGLNVRPKESHALQMALYKEVLYYSLDIPRDAVNTYLFYSQYPKLFAERSAKAQIQRAIGLRNSIIANECIMKKDGGRSLIPTITTRLLNTHGVKGRLWEEYQRPQLEAFLAPFHTDETLLTDYFYTFTAFVSREQFLSKTGDVRQGSSQGFSSTWSSDTLTKLSAGNILTGLEIIEFVGDEGIEKVILKMPQYGENFLPNFRQGDIVMLYERNGEEDNATNHQIIRGNVEQIDMHHITVCIRNKQRNTAIFTPQSLYAIEHDYMDSSYTALYKGLYALLTTPQHRRDLLLCRRQPETDTTLTINGHYPNRQIQEIVTKAKQAQDYFLLIGPPGTGKTSVALRSMVEEFHGDTDNNILLLSYTNRAVDEICEMLENISPSPTYMRIGSELSCEKRFQPHLTGNMMQTCTNRIQVRQKLDTIRIIVGTVSSISGHPELFELKHFNIAIIDEASQILEPQILGILCAHQGGQCAVDKFILIGDHKQLPAVVLQRNEESRVTNKQLNDIGLTDCRNSLFERLLGRQKQSHAYAMLHRQGRMHPDISGFVNRQFYNEQLDIVPVRHQQEPLEWIHYDKADDQQALVATSRMKFIDIPYPPAEEPHKINRCEARQTAALVKAIHELCRQNNLPFNAARRIGIIVPFRNQIAMIANELALLDIEGTEEITIDTVERYQGSQRDIIIFSTTVSQRYQLDILSVSSITDGQTIDRKLNVALTRARKQMFIVGNAHLLNNLPIYKQLIEYAKEI
ncbi:MAG: DNA2/NAM7 family helicase, partial [Bacteroidaceae bacterium]|nr:DNA2/NAM7 family helicase [Bacteroidaceae bacterium]